MSCRNAQFWGLTAGKGEVHPHVVLACRALEVLGAIVPLANGYFQVRKTSQCQAENREQTFVLNWKNKRRNGGSAYEHEASASIHGAREVAHS